MMKLLENIMWNCLSGPHAKFAAGAGAVRRYAPGFSAIVGCEDPEHPDFATLEKYCEPGESFYLDVWSGPAPAGWRIEKEAQMFKMIWEAPVPIDDAAPDAVPLTPVHLSEALALAKRYGMDPDQLREALKLSSADNYVLRNWGVNTMAWAEDDMEIVQQMAAERSLGLPQAGLNREICRALKPKRFKLDEYGV